MNRHGGIGKCAQVVMKGDCADRGGGEMRPWEMAGNLAVKTLAKAQKQ